DLNGVNSNEYKSFEHNGNDENSEKASDADSAFLTNSLNNLFVCLRETKSETLASLDQENAHFLISEKLISTIESIKTKCCNNGCHEKLKSGTSLFTSQKQPFLNNNDTVHQSTVNSSDYLPTPSTSSSSSYLTSESGIFSDNEQSKSATSDPLENSDLSFSDASMFENSSFEESIRQNVNSYTPLEISFTSSIQNEKCEALNTSAENIAVNLLRRFSEKHVLPRNPAELDWIVSENEAPQQLLPLPAFIHIDEENEGIRLRGNLEWAPLRPQLILHIQPFVKRKIQIVKQNFRCAGCGLKVEREYIPRMLHCAYTGKYFCQHGCHSGKKSIIPAYVINKWDFTFYPVSNYAKNFIEKIMFDPLFNINDLNANLYKKVKFLSRLLELRTQLTCLKDYIYTCKKRETILLDYITFEPKHFLKPDVHIYSLRDLIDVKMKNHLVERCNKIVCESIKHVTQCSLCQAKGFICELCSKKSNKFDILFPFEIGKVKQCQVCKACYHIKCFHASYSCLKCERLKRRRSQSCLFND
ncbi:run domain Beclin-1 interacting and cysteine-rich containing protein-like isoform X2, partial [Dinothrombium tinctorium]